MKPVVVVNFKTYKQGKKVLRLAKKIEKVSKDVIVGVQACDVLEVASGTGLDVYCQHVDWRKVGRGTGFVLPEAVKVDGAVGVFLNHSEHPVSFSDLKKTVRRCREVGLRVLVFVSSLREALKVEKLGVDYLVVEPAELVGGSKSVSSVKRYVAGFAKKLKGDFLVGAGVKTRKDVVSALRDGACGVAVSSGVVGARSSGEVLRELLAISR